jgi:hypothetical protein
MSSSCEYDIYFEGYFHGDLSPAEELAVQTHLLNCPRCRNKIEAFYRAHSALKEYERPTPPAELAKAYHKNVNLSYGKETFTQKLLLLIYSLTSYRSATFRLAELAMLLIIGFIVGWIIFAPSKEPIVISGNYPGQYLRPVTGVDIDFVYYYLVASEILLLDIQNTGENSDFSIDRELAQNLLIKTFRIHEIALQLNNLRLINFIGHMQFLLPEVSNTKPEELKEFIDTIKMVIKQANLLQEVDILKRTIKQPLKRPGT